MKENVKEGKMNDGKVGQRVRLISTSRPDSAVECGETGTIWHVVIHDGARRVRWDKGSRLDLHPDKDKWEVLD